MALGSSAPEIMLATIEICIKGFKAGDLGPGTIIGSAAFNLLMISAICNSAIPEANDEGETGIRRIKEFMVFCITAAASLFAYVWMWLVLDVISPKVVDVWEAIFTLMCFPILIFIAWCADRNWFNIFNKKGQIQQPNETKY